MSAVVVDLPLVPVMTTVLLPLPALARSRKKSSMSPMTSTPALRAFRTLQCGSGCLSGMPGARTSAAKDEKLAADKSVTAKPAAAASSRAVSLSSQMVTRAPPSASARAVARPLSPAPTTATSQPAKIVTGIMG